MPKIHDGPIPLLTLEAQIKRNLRRHLASLGFQKDENGLLRPPEVSKACFRTLHLAQRNARLQKESAFIKSHWKTLKCKFANGDEVEPRLISPRLELISADTWQSDLFRLASLTWSVPVSQGYGRRMRFLVWDDANDKLIGIFVRDKWIGWTLEQRELRLVNLLDAYVLGAVPPYNMLLGAKLIASLICTKEVCDKFEERYGKTKGIISKKRKHAELCLVTTTSALGRSSIYNRLKLDGKNIFTSIGYTSGWGHFHIPDALFAKIRTYLENSNDAYADNHRFGDGPNWKLRAVRKVLSMIGMDSNLMRHGIGREVFVCPLASNAQCVLRGNSPSANYSGLKAAKEIAAEALGRWIIPRAERKPEFKVWRRDSLEQMLKPVKAVSQRFDESKTGAA
jgi:hypothetical protein